MWQYVRSGARQDRCYYIPLIGSDMWPIEYRKLPIPMTLSDLQGHLPTTSLLDVISLYSCVTVHGVSTDIVHGTIPL